MFSARTSLMPHQEPAVAKLLPARVGALFMDMGTGKSRTLIDIARLRQERWDKLFWFTPCALRDNVREQVLIHTDLDPSAIAIWDGAEPSRGALIHIVGVESIGASDRTVMRYLDHVTPSSFVAVDESTYIKGDRAKRSQRLRHMSAQCRYRVIMTGTPITQGIVDLYSQMAFLSPKILGYRSFWSFAANHLEYEIREGRKTGRIIRSHNADYLAAKMAPYVYQVRKDECLDLPDKLYETRYFCMSPTQRELYEQAKDEILALDYDDWSPIRIFHLFTSLQTIVCGFWQRPCGETVEMQHGRINLLMQTLAEIPAGEKVIVWAKYRYAARQITAAIEAQYGAGSAIEFHGDVPDAARRRALARWRAEATYLVATQDTGGHGLTLNEAAYAVFYADGYKYATRIQAEDRNHRIGQARRPTYISLACLQSIDARIETALARKGDALESFRCEIDGCRKSRLKERAMTLVRSL